MTVPNPDLDTVSGYVCVWILNVAVTLLVSFMVTLQVVPMTESHPLQPKKIESLAAAGVRVTLMPELKLALQFVPQLIPSGMLVTIPVPVPDLLMLSEY